jgi:NAD(P)-dependent dehydrogenase (short-subunit alcohol dehydrogenase family)
MSVYSYDLRSRVALVTGASSGLGNHFARVLAASGAKVVMAARRLTLLDDLCDVITADGGAAVAVEMDVADEASVIAAYDRAEAAFGPVDTIVANAGINLPGSSLGLAIDDFDRMVDVNVRGVFLTAREGASRSSPRPPRIRHRSASPPIARPRPRSRNWVARWRRIGRARASTSTCCAPAISRPNSTPTSGRSRWAKNCSMALPAVA